MPYMKRYEDRSSFEVFKSNICHLVKYNGEIEFIKEVLCSKKIQQLYQKEWYAECLYLLAMVDYLSRKNDIPLYNGFDELRHCKLKQVVFPSSIMMRYLVTKDERILKESYDNSIPEFKRFNIVENEVENVV